MRTSGSDLDARVDRLLVRHKVKTDLIRILRREAEEIAQKIRRLEWKGKK